MRTKEEKGGAGSETVCWDYFPQTRWKWQWGKEAAIFVLMIKLLSHIKKIPIVHGHTCPTICVGVTVRRSSGFQVATRSVTAPLCWLLLPSVHLNDCVWSVWELQLGFQSPLGALQFMFFMHRPAMTLSTANCTYSMFINDIQIVFFRSAWQIWRTPQRAGRARLSQVWGRGAPADV